jgi:hypothetical protein
MKYEINDFIAVFDNAFDKDFCQGTIRYYESMSKAGFGKDRKSSDNVPSSMKDGSQVFFTDTVNGLVAPTNISSHIITELWDKYYHIYREKFSVLHTRDPQGIYEMKIQKTEPAQGYHIWHFETGSRPCSNRLFNFHVYLNTVEDGGETEFLYLSRRVKPVEGRVVIYPCGFTHTHRGNPPLSGTKYLLNGWIQY